MSINTTGMLSQQITDRRAWRSDTVGQAPHALWYFRLSDDCLDELETYVATAQIPFNLVQDPDALLTLPLPSAKFRRCSAFLKGAIEELRRGYGFVLIDGLPLDGHSLNEAEVMFWVISKIIGEPIRLRGHLLTHVRNVEGTIKEFAAYSQSNEETTFHNDMSFHDHVPNLISLFCIQPALSGGQNQLISAYTLHNALLAEYPDLVQTLYQPFYIDRRGHVSEAERLGQTPIFQWNNVELCMRWQDYRIRWGFQIANKQPTPAQERALNAVNNMIARQGFCFNHYLQRGQILIANNRNILHYRSAFQDHSESELRRHLLRIMMMFD